MEKLLYKTRGDSDPKGKPKVYFLCHKEDFDKYFSNISSEILLQENCSIWYKENTEDNIAEELFDDLQEMQLCVALVTGNFLNDENNALNAEFKFAMENHIPVLPIMVEEGLTEIFNKKFGNIQLLEKTDDDTYIEKLKKYLSSVLIGEQLIEKIRGAFDAYVFLSYRKKDKRYARELMKLIHKNDFLRDIAIWYDEYLTPGENFDNSIKEALIKSDLFMLAVTPNLYNEENYIMTTEYPMAKQENKPIISAEVVPVDKDELAKKYEGIPEIVNPYDTEILSDEIIKNIKKLAIKENNSSPEHNFFIGLAYLGGIDVEVDHEKALYLITDSANAGLDMAMKKLVDMYMRGDGVEINFYEALKWQQKLADLYFTIYKENNSKENINNYLDALWALGDDEFNLGEFRKAEKNYFKMANLYEEINDRKNLAFSYCKLAATSIEQGNVNKGRDYYLKSIAIYEKNVKGILKKKNPDDYHDLFSAYCNLGQLEYDLGNSDEGKKYFKKGLEIAEYIDKKFDDKRGKENKASVYINLGTFEFSDNNMKAAKEYFEYTFSIYKLRAERVRSIASYRSLMVCYNKLADVYFCEDDYEKAKELYEAGADIAYNISEQTKTINSYKDLVFSYDRLVKLEKAMGNEEKAKQYLFTSLDIKQKLSEDSLDIGIYESLFISYNELGNIFREEGNIEDAKKAFETALDIAGVTLRQKEYISYYEDVSLSAFNLGEICCMENDLESAKEYFKIAVEKDEYIYNKRKNDMDYIKLGIALYYLSEVSNDKEITKRAYDMFKVIHKNNPDIEDYKNIVEHLEKSL
jgi:tetratricopeptide (TPR) repeat protein